MNKRIKKKKRKQEEAEFVLRMILDSDFRNKIFKEEELSRRSRNQDLDSGWNVEVKQLTKQEMQEGVLSIGVKITGVF
jgi:hypothetical protein